jgi:adenine-specific DNA-methyltransferase
MPVIQFKGKTAIESYHYTVPHHTLDFHAKLSVLPKGEKPSLDGNLIIEGDNLLALKALLPTHTGRIKCIYIDPPYNTGNEGWVYNDNLTQPQFREWIGKTVGKEGEDFTRHDKWCCMMYPRLELLKDLLAKDGSIFISIDDNEFAHLRMLMDEVFGPENFVATIIWHKMDSPKNTAAQFSEDHDYILVYAKNGAEWSPKLLQRSEQMKARYKNPDNDARGPWLLGDLAARNFYSLGTYEIKTPSGKIITGPPAGSYWRVSKEKFDELDRENRIWWGKGDVRPGIKRFLSEVREGVVPQTIWSWKDVGSTRNAKQYLSQLLGKKAGEEIFTTPKPVELILRIVDLATDKDSIVLDSFAGSGTTAESVLRANEQDRGKRRFILIQQPHDTKEDERDETNIARRLTAARLKRVLKGLKTESEVGFTYAEIGPKLFGEYRDFGKILPSYQELAKYIFYTETSSDFDKKALNTKTGKIGECRKTSYYLLYTPNNKEGQALDLKWLKSIEKSEKNKNIVVYCEKIWIHRDDLAQYQKQTDRKVRPMLVPFNLK